MSETINPSATSSLAAFDAAQAKLAAATTPELLRAAYSLTHQMHAVSYDLPSTRDLRQQRDMIDAEIIRRASHRHLTAVTA